MEVRDGVDELCWGSCVDEFLELGFEEVDAHAVVVKRNAVDLGLQLAQWPEPAHERRGFTDGGIANVQECLGDGCQAVVRPVDDQQFPGVGLNAFPPLEFRGQDLPQANETGGIAVHQREVAFRSGEDSLKGFDQLHLGERGGIGLACAHVVARARRPGELDWRKWGGDLAVEAIEVRQGRCARGCRRCRHVGRSLTLSGASRGGLYGHGTDVARTLMHWECVARSRCQSLQRCSVRFEAGVPVIDGEMDP